MFVLPGPMADVDYRAILDVMDRPPDLLIGPDKSDPHIRRWWLIPRNDFCNIYLHEIRKDDDDRALHDHPYDFESIILEGSYRERTVDAKGRVVSEIFRKGMLNAKKAEQAHRLEVIEGPVLTLLVSGPRRREWGFHAKGGWRPWKDFIDERDYGRMRTECKSD
jgi:hypothetical protein